MTQEACVAFLNSRELFENPRSWPSVQSSSQQQAPDADRAGARHAALRVLGHRFLPARDEPRGGGGRGRRAEDLRAGIRGRHASAAGTPARAAWAVLLSLGVRYARDPHAGAPRPDLPTPYDA